MCMEDRMRLSSACQYVTFFLCQDYDLRFLDFLAVSSVVVDEYEGLESLAVLGMHM